jgi:hypothetical protein
MPRLVQLVETGAQPPSLGPPLLQTLPRARSLTQWSGQAQSESEVQPASSLKVNASEQPALCADEPPLEEPPELPPAEPARRLGLATAPELAPELA